MKAFILDRYRRDRPELTKTADLFRAVKHIVTNWNGRPPLMRSAILLAALSGSTASTAQSLPTDMRDVLVSEFKFSQADLAKAEKGMGVARVVSTAKPDDVLIAGVIRIEVSSEEFMRAYRDFEHFPASKESVRVGRLGAPVKEADLANFRFPDLNKKDLLACHPGTCAYKMPAYAMEELRSKIDWAAPEADERVQAMARRMTLAALTDYQTRGDPALVTYYDSQAPYSVAEGLHWLLGEEAHIAAIFPALLRYAAEYPKGKPSSLDDYFYC